VVAFTYLSNHAALAVELISPHQHESHFVFDICYHNTTDIRPSVITGDMHSENDKLRGFGGRDNRQPCLSLRCSEGQTAFLLTK
jgi:hypothetical protein